MVVPGGIGRMGTPEATAGLAGRGDPGDERWLVDGLIAGDRHAIASFLERTHHAVYAFAFRLGGDPETRRDWTHEALLGLLEDLRRGRFVYRGPGSFWAWFRKRAYYRVLDERRRGRRRWEREGGGKVDEEGDVDLDAYAGAEDPACEFERVEIRAAIESCLEKLPSADQRRALWLLYAEDRPYQEIAAAMGSSLNTVRSWIRRGRLLLRKCLIIALDIHIASGGALD
jgi:RNA polymerase sigma-70 factor (ECF subfamily)